CTRDRSSGQRRDAGLRRLPYPSIEWIVAAGRRDALGAYLHGAASAAPRAIPRAADVAARPDDRRGGDGQRSRPTGRKQGGSRFVRVERRRDGYCSHVLPEFEVAAFGYRQAGSSSGRVGTIAEQYQTAQVRAIRGRGMGAGTGRAFRKSLGDG